jgi:hypothetical protein
MSQLETIMLVALGFVLAALIALFLGKAAWNLAYRLGARRTRKQVPANLLEMQTERDKLRAEFAMLQRRSEVEAERIKAQSVEQTAEVMRNRNRIALLGQELDRREKQIAEQDSVIKALQEQVVVIEEELARRTETIADMEKEVARWQAAAASVMPGETAHSEPVRRFGGEPALRFEPPRPAPLPADPDPDLAMTQHRLSRRIRDLTRITEQFRSDPSMRAAGRPTPEIRPSPVAFRSLPASNWESENATHANHAEIRRDGVRPGSDAWRDGQPHPENVAAQPEPEPAPAGASLSPSIANVVSLAQRLRNLKKDFSS